MTDFLLGKLPGGEREQLAAHLERCAACQVLCEACEREADVLVSELQRAGVAHHDGQSLFEREPELQWALREIRALGTNRAEESLIRPIRLVGAPGGDEFGSADAIGAARCDEAQYAAPGSMRGVGDTIGAYQLLERIARGGMGTIYKALHRQLEKVVAVKVLPAERWNSPDARRRFHQEMKAVGKFDHPHIVRAFDAGQADGLLFLVMEYVDGIDLSRLVRRVGPLPAAEACELARQAAIGLQHVHEHGLVHRDIKPSNLMLACDGVLKVLDLGVARLESELFTADAPVNDTTCTGRTEPTLADLTSTGQFLGTSDYMAPEQWENTRGVDIRTDLYSLGCTLYQLLTGRPPFDRPEYNTVFRKMKAHAEIAPPPLPTDRPDIDATLSALVARLLEKDPAARFSTPAEVAEALTPLASDHNLPVLIKAADEGRPLRNSHGSPSAPPERTGLAFPSPSSPAVATHVSSTKALPGSWPSRRMAISIAGCLMLLAAVLVTVGHRWQTTEGVDRGGPISPSVSIRHVQEAESGDRSIASENQTATIAIGKPLLEGGLPSATSGETTEPWQMMLPIPRRNVWAVAWSPDDRYLALAEGDSLRICDAVTWQTVATCVGHTEVVTSLAWDARGTRLASASADGTVRIWRPDGMCEAILEGHSDFVVTLAWSPDDRWIASGSADGTVRLWRNNSERSERVLTSVQERRGAMEHFVVAVAWSPDGHRLASAGNDCRIRLWEVGGNQAAVLSGHRASVTAVAWSPDGRQIASGGGDNTVRIWQTARPTEASVTLTGHEQPVTAVAWSSDGRWIASSSYDGTIRLWNGEIPGPVLRAMGGTVHAVGWNADGSRLVAGLQDGTVWFWDVTSESPQLAMVLAGRGAPIALASADRLRSIVPDDSGGQPMYFVKQPDGVVAVLRPSEFYELVSQRNESD